MSLREILKVASDEALRSGQKDTRRILSYALSKFINQEKEFGFKEWTSELEIETMRSHVKALRKAAEQMKDTKWHSDYLEEAKFIERLLPILPTLEETVDLVRPYAETAKNLGMFIGAVMKDYKGKLDPAVVRQVGIQLGLKQ